MNLSDFLSRMATLALLLALSACGGSRSGNEESPSGPDPDRTLLDAAQQPLDRARSVEEINAQRKAELDRELAESEK